MVARVPFRITDSTYDGLLTAEYDMTKLKSRLEGETMKNIKDSTVLKIRKEFAKGKLTLAQIARRFRTSQASVSRIGNYVQRASVK